MKKELKSVESFNVITSKKFEVMFRRGKHKSSLKTPSVHIVIVCLLNCYR